MASESQNFSSSPIVYSEGTASVAELSVHLRGCETNFVKDLENRVNIDEYAAKIKKHALVFEGWQDKHLIGVLAAYFNKDTSICFVSNVSVLPGFNKKGIGKQLLDLCLDFAKNHNFGKIRLEVGRNNIPAQSFYTRNGFQVAEEQDTFFIMELKIIKP